jgi:C1A family cysteine protease
MTEDHNNTHSDEYYLSIYNLYPFIEQKKKNPLDLLVERISKQFRVGIESLSVKQSYVTNNEFVLPIEDQGKTMCCFSYAVSYMLRVRQRNAGKSVQDYSPRHLHFCNFELPFNLGPSTAYAFKILKSKGVPVYSTPNSDWLDGVFCSTKPATQIAQIKDLRVLKTSDIVKNEIAYGGAVVANILVDKSFFNSYERGTIYTVKDYSSGLKPHCVCLTGFDDTLRCWIGVNSFGTDWGENGFFKLSYDGCGILEDEVYPVFAIDLQ